MKRMTKQRETQEWSKSELARRAVMNPGAISQIESGRLIPYPSQLTKIAAALGWEGAPEELLEEVQA